MEEQKDVVVLDCVDWRLHSPFCMSTCRNDGSRLETGDQIRAQSHPEDPGLHGDKPNGPHPPGGDGALGWGSSGPSNCV